MNKAALIVLALALLSLLVFRFQQSSHTVSKYVDGQTVTITTTLSSPPRISGSVQHITVFIPDKQPIFVTLPRSPELFYGQSVHISGIVEVKVLDNKKTVMTMYFPTFEASKKPNSFSQNIRFKVASVFQKTLPFDSSSLLFGIVLGGKAEMSPHFKESLQKAGVMHVVAASGMNVVLVGSFLASIFGFFLRRQIAILVTIFGILVYAVLAGLEPSIVRAAIMGILILCAQLLGRQYLASYGFFLAAYTMLFVDPLILYDIGFQLSFMATSGLLWVGPALNVILREPKDLGSIGFKILHSVQNDMKMTLSAQAATLPILLANFGSFSVFSILANLLVLWTIPILMILGGIAAIFSFIFEPISQALLYLCLPFLIYFETVVYGLAQLPVFEISSVPFISIVGYYLMLVAIILKFQIKSLNEK